MIVLKRTVQNVRTEFALTQFAIAMTVSADVIVKCQVKIIHFLMVLTVIIITFL